MSRLNNKRLGMEFEREMCNRLKAEGWWVHFLTPDASGAQPFDLIAVKNSDALACDCKVSSVPIFSIQRLEENQLSAFDYWVRCGNLSPILWVKWADGIYQVDYLILKAMGKVDLRTLPKLQYGGDKS